VLGVIMAHVPPTAVRQGHLISAAVARAIYRRGLGLVPQEWSRFAVSTERDGPIVLVVGNGCDGVVDVMCSNSVPREELRAFVGPLPS